jgi:hypothetical protein
LDSDETDDADEMDGSNVWLGKGGAGCDETGTVKRWLRFWVARYNHPDVDGRANGKKRTVRKCFPESVEAGLRDRASRRASTSPIRRQGRIRCPRERVTRNLRDKNGS